MCEIVFLTGDWAHPFSSIRSNLEFFSYVAECSLLGARPLILVRVLQRACALILVHAMQ